MIFIISTVAIAISFFSVASIVVLSRIDRRDHVKFMAETQEMIDTMRRRRRER